MVTIDSPVASATSWSSWAWVMGVFLLWGETTPGPPAQAHGGPEVDVVDG